MKHKTHYKIRTIEEKKEILNYYREHGSGKTAAKYNLAVSSLQHWKKRVESGGYNPDNPLERKIKKRNIFPETVAFVRQLRKQYPDYSVARLQQLAMKKQKISMTTIWHILHDDPSRWSYTACE